MTLQLCSEDLLIAPVDLWMDVTWFRFEQFHRLFIQKISIIENCAAKDEVDF